MFRKFQLLKKLSTPPLCPFTAFSSQFPLQTPSIYKIFKNTYSSSTFKINYYKEDVDLLNGLSSEDKAHMSKVLDKYFSDKESLTQMTPDEVKLIQSALHHLSLAKNQAENHVKALEYLVEKDSLFRKLGIKDTIDVALNNYQMSSTLISQQRYVEAEQFLKEIRRICELLGENSQTKSLTVQSWYLLAQVENQFSQDKALKLYNAVLENISDVNESELPALLPYLHREMGKIYHSHGDNEKMIESWKNGLQAAIKHLGENSTVAFEFLCDIVDNLALRDHNETAEPYAENRVQMALKIFPTSHEKVAISYSLLGNIYLANEKYSEAVNSYNEAFQIFEKLPKDYSYMLYDVYFSMATAQFLLENPQEASKFLAKADQALIKANGEPNPSVAAVYCRWVNDLNQLEMPAAAREFYLKALDICKTFDPSNERMIFAISYGLGQIALSRANSGEGDWDQALEIWKQVEKHLDLTDAPSVQMVYITLDSIYSNLDNREESEKCVQKVLESCEATGDTSDAFDTYYESGKSYEEEGQLEEALPCYETAARVYEKDASKDPAKTQNLLVKISQIKGKLQTKI